MTISRRRGIEARVFFMASWLLGLSAIWFRPGPALLIGGDSGIYARIARELAERPLSSWWSLTLDGQPFFEHPPLGFWLEAVAFLFGGVSVETARMVPRIASSLTLLFAGLAGWETGARSLQPTDDGAPATLGAFAMLGTLLLSGFLYCSQVAMLEAPLLLSLSLALWATAALLESPRSGPGARRVVATATFGIAVTAGVWVKGPPALVALAPLAALGALRRISLRQALVAGALALGLAVMSTWLWDAWCLSRGREPFFQHYLHHQVAPSITEGRHNPNRDPFFYWSPLWGWYGPGFFAAGAALALTFFRGSPWARRWTPELSVLGGVTWLGVVVGFSIVTQKYQWYIHLGAIGVGLLVGSVLALLPTRLVPPLAALALLAALAWPVVARRVPFSLTGSQREILAVQSTPGPPLPGERVADCSGMEAWASEHLIGFFWRAARVPCEAEAGWRWDGTTLTKR